MCCFSSSIFLLFGVSKMLFWRRSSGWKILFYLSYATFMLFSQKNKLRHLIIIRCHSLLSQKLDSIKPLSHPRCVLISGSNNKEFLCACNDAGDYNDFILLSLTCFSFHFPYVFAALYSAAELIFTHTATAILS